MNWRLSRAVLRGAPLELSFSRNLQVALASYFAGARFKFFDGTMAGGSALFPALCSLCGWRDREKNFLTHIEKLIPINDPEASIDFSVRLARIACVTNPHLPTHVPFVVASELELDQMNWTPAQLAKMLKSRFRLIVHVARSGQWVPRNLEVLTSYFGFPSLFPVSGTN